MTTPTGPAANRPRPLDLGDLRRLEPIDPDFGLGRGRPVDRWYIERFLDAHRADVRGNVLEVADDHYTRRFGEGRVAVADVLHRSAGNERATLIGDLSDGANLPADRFDCFICTQTLQYVFELAPAIATIRRILKPGGVLLLSVPGISQISPYDREHWGEHWRFTPQSVERLLRAEFGEVEAAGHGNVLSAIAFLHGMAWDDLQAHELAHPDDRYPLVVTARAVKAPTPAS
jgi:SAM-dependent methyltransferase